MCVMATDHRKVLSATSQADLQVGCAEARNTSDPLHVCSSPTHNSLRSQAIRSRQPRRSYVHAVIARWFIALTCGLAIGVLTFFFNWVRVFLCKCANLQSAVVPSP